jgi:DNA-binding response OmpR family regulator
VKDQPLTLTRREYDLLLLFLLANPNRVLTKEAIAEYIWGDDADMAVYASPFGKPVVSRG